MSVASCPSSKSFNLTKRSSNHSAVPWTIGSKPIDLSWICSSLCTYIQMPVVILTYLRPVHLEEERKGDIFGGYLGGL